jgi:hypothetical protein
MVAGGHVDKCELCKLTCQHCRRMRADAKPSFGKVRVHIWAHYCVLFPSHVHVGVAQKLNTYGNWNLAMCGKKFQTVWGLEKTELSYRMNHEREHAGQPRYH